MQKIVINNLNYGEFLEEIGNQLEIGRIVDSTFPKLMELTTVGEYEVYGTDGYVKVTIVNVQEIIQNQKYQFDFIISWLTLIAFIIVYFCMAYKVTRIAYELVVARLLALYVFGSFFIVNEVEE